MNKNTKNAKSHGNGNLGKATMRTTMGKQETNLRRNGFLRFQLGLIIALLLVYGGLEASWAIFYPDIPEEPEPIPQEEYWVQNWRPEEAKKAPREQVKKKSKKLLFDDVFVIGENESDTTKDEESVANSHSKGSEVTISVDSIAYIDPNPQDDFVINVVHEIPIFPGCENVSREEMLGCFQSKMRKHIKRNFKYPQTAIGLGQSGKVATVFKIDKNGNVIDVQVKGPAKLLENEAERIINKLPQMVPGKHNGNKPGKDRCDLNLVIRTRVG